MFSRRCIAVVFALCVSAAWASPTKHTPKTYHNPIKPGYGADPWMIKHGDAYYMTYSVGGTHVEVNRANNVAGPWPSAGTLVYQPPSDLHELWAPELHRIGSSWYVYVSMDDGGNGNHRMRVLKGTDDNDPTKPFELVGPVTSVDDNWSIDGTILNHPNGEMYMVWSGWSDAKHVNTQNLYIAHMASPTHIDSARVLLHQPTQPWEQSMLGATTRAGVNEGPTTITHGNQTFLIYSAAGSWGDDYCLGMMGIDNSADPMVASNWWRKDDAPVFSRVPGVFGPGHASYVQDRDGTPYIVYHADESSGAGWGGRTIRTQAFHFGDDDMPVFPKAVPFDVALPMPA